MSMAVVIAHQNGLGMAAYRRQQHERLTVAIDKAYLYNAENASEYWIHTGCVASTWAKPA